jgi:hypothetical protein
MTEAMRIAKVYLLKEARRGAAVVGAVRAPAAAHRLGGARLREVVPGTLPRAGRGRRVLSGTRGFPNAH